MSSPSSSSRNDQWQQTFRFLKNWVAQFGKLPYQKSDHSYEKKLGRWVNHQLIIYKQKEKGGPRCEQWTEFVSQHVDLFLSPQEIWNKTLKHLETWFLTCGKRPSNTSNDLEERRLGGWMYAQQSNFKLKKAAMKESDPRREQWAAFVKQWADLFLSADEFWTKRFQQLKDWVARFNERPSSAITGTPGEQQLGAWMYAQQILYNCKKGLMKEGAPRREQWTALMNQYADLFLSADELWAKRFHQLKDWVARFNARPSAKTGTPGEQQLGAWMYAQQTLYNCKKSLMKEGDPRRAMWAGFLERKTDFPVDY